MTEPQSPPPDSQRAIQRWENEGGATPKDAAVAGPRSGAGVTTKGRKQSNATRKLQG